MKLRRPRRPHRSPFHNRPKPGPIHPRPRADLPQAQGLYHLAPQLLTLDLGYQSTLSPARGTTWWTRPGAAASLPTGKLPGDMVTLDTVNLWTRTRPTTAEARSRCWPRLATAWSPGAAAKMRGSGAGTRLATLKSCRVKFDKGAGLVGGDTPELEQTPTT